MSGKNEAEFTSGRKTSIRYYEVVLSVHLSGRRLYTTSSLPFPITLRQRAFLLELFIVPYQVFQGVVEFV